MRIHILAVGRDRKGPSVDLVSDYAKRCPWRIELVEVPPRRQGTSRQRLVEEAEKLRQFFPKGAALIALDERGQDLDSRAFADRIQKFQLDGKNALCFVIGSADGLDPILVKSADLRLAFGRATWPHRLVRVMLSEQIYRASTILTGHPYHRD
ncbi:MAG: 23S rRNA (pseudouridine(1915)-N(3))-methyltransferase RlmH [Geminicoccales bacterium]